MITKTIAAAAVIGIGLFSAATTIDTETATAMHRSWGYHINPDGSYTPAAPPATTIQVQPVRANVHSGGRTGGFPNKRVGCGGCKDHPANNHITVGGLNGVQPLMTDGFGRNRGTRLHHPRDTCRCN